MLMFLYLIRHKKAQGLLSALGFCCIYWTLGEHSLEYVEEHNGQDGACRQRNHP